MYHIYLILANSQQTQMDRRLATFHERAKNDPNAIPLVTGGGQLHLTDRRQTINEAEYTRFKIVRILVS